MLEAANDAPSAGNIQPCFFYVIVDKNVIKDIYGKVFTQEWAINAPVIIIACTNQNTSESRYADRGRDVYAYLDCAASIQSILLCATDLGLASCWIGDFNMNECKKFINSEEYTPVALITIGYAQSTLIKSSKRPLSSSYKIIGESAIDSIDEGSSSLEIRHCDISHAIFDDVNLYQCKIQNANMFQAKINDVNLKESSIMYSNLENLHITNCLVEGLTID